MTQQRLPIPDALLRQARSFPWESRLLALARRSHPRATWWWGSKSSRNTAQAVCYVCDRTITRWSRLRGWDLSNMQRIEDHKMSHYQEVMP